MRIDVSAAGLDPYVSYFPGRYGGKQGLVLDLMEPLRPAIDRVVLDFVQRHTFSAGDVTLRDDGVCRINPQLVGQIAGSLAKRVPMMKSATELRSQISAM